MTLPNSGPLSLGAIQAETGDTGDISLQWVYDNSQGGAKSTTLATYYSTAWYQRNVDGNCNNGNCTNNCNCGNLQCVNCFISGTVNCANCDTRNWLQYNCNCACTYNCTTSQTASYNCDCVCACDCLCQCDCG